MSWLRDRRLNQQIRPSDRFGRRRHVRDRLILRVPPEGYPGGRLVSGPLATAGELAETVLSAMGRVRNAVGKEKL